MWRIFYFVWNWFDWQRWYRLNFSREETFQQSIKCDEKFELFIEQPFHVSEVKHFTLTYFLFFFFFAISQLQTSAQALFYWSNIQNQNSNVLCVDTFLIIFFFCFFLSLFALHMIIWTTDLLKHSTLFGRKYWTWIEVQLICDTYVHCCVHYSFLVSLAYVKRSNEKHTHTQNPKGTQVGPKHTNFVFYHFVYGFEFYLFIQWRLPQIRETSIKLITYNWLFIRISIWMEFLSSKKFKLNAYQL